MQIDDHVPILKSSRTTYFDSLEIHKLKFGGTFGETKDQEGILLLNGKMTKVIHRDSNSKVLWVLQYFTKNSNRNNDYEAISVSRQW